MDKPVEVMAPVDPVVAAGILANVDSLIDWQKTAIQKSEQAGIRLARLIADVATNAYWIVRGHASEREYVEKTFPQSRSQYFILRRIGTTLQIYPQQILEEIGVSKCQDLVRIHNYNGVIGPNWFIWAKTENRDEFRDRVRAHVGKCLPAVPQKDEPKIVSFRIDPDFIPVYNLAMQMAQQESGSVVPSYNVSLIFAEFVAGHNEDGNRLQDSNALIIKLLPAFIRLLKIGKDLSVIDRAISAIRTALEELKDGPKVQEA